MLRGSLGGAGSGAHASSKKTSGPPRCVSLWRHYFPFVRLRYQLYEFGWRISARIGHDLAVINTYRK